MAEQSHPVLARVYDPAMRHVEDEVLPEHRRYLVADAAGTVLDLGAGTGAMFPYFREAAADRDVSFVAVEPDPHMARRAKRRARDLGLDVRIERVGAESLPFADDSVDRVVASLVFCTVDDVDAAFDEVARVLRPGGEFRFLEHVRGEGARGVALDVVAPAWRRVAGGCHPNRETDETFLRDDRFRLVDFRRVDVFPFVPVVRGTLRRRG